MSRRRLLLLLWLVLIAMVLIWTLVGYNRVSDPQLQNEILLRHGIVMLVLSLPMGWFLSAMMGMAFAAFGFELTGLSDAIAISLACTVAGYLQWFVIAPWLWHRWAAYRARNVARVE